MNVPLVVCGPTGTGKTDLAVGVAVRFDAVVVSMDAMAVYRGMDIGTAKPSLAERRGVPHLGIDLRHPTEPFDAGAFCDLLEQALARWPRVIVCGGTHLYVKTWRDGLAPAPRVDAVLRASLEATPGLRGWLARVDPPLAGRLHDNDRNRLVRGLEVWLTTGQRLSDLQVRGRKDRAASLVWCDCPDLDERLARRTARMFDAGWEAEVAGLLASGVPERCRPMLGLGYRDVVDIVCGRTTRAVAQERIGVDTRRFARKQRTWRRSLGVEPATHPLDDALRCAEALWG